MHVCRLIVGLVIATVAVAEAGGGAAKPHAYTSTQHNGPDVVHVTKLTFAPLAEWKERVDKGAKLPAFQNSAGDTVLLLDDISVTGKTPAERLDAGVRTMFLDTSDKSKIERTDRGSGRWWVVDRHAKMRAVHAALFVPDAEGYLAVCDVRVEDAKQLDALSPVCDTLTVTSSADKKP